MDFSLWVAADIEILLELEFYVKGWTECDHCSEGGNALIIFHFNFTHFTPQHENLPPYIHAHIDTQITTTTAGVAHEVPPLPEVRHEGHPRFLPL